VCFGCLATLPSSAQTPRGTEFRVNNTITANKDRPKVTVSRGGNFQVVWQAGAFPDQNIFSRRFSSTGAALTNDVAVNLQTLSGQQDYPNAGSLNSNGAFVVVWRTSLASTQSEDSINAKMYDSNGTQFGGPNLSDEFLVDAYTSSGVVRGQTAVAGDAGGNFVAVWSGPIQGSCCNGGIAGRRFNSSGTALGGNFAVAAQPNGIIFLHPSIAMAPSGNFVVTWDAAGYPAEQYEIVGQRFSSSGAALGGTFKVNSYTTNRQSYSSVGSDASGNFVVVWTSGDNYTGTLNGQRYKSDGTLLGGEFQVSGTAKKGPTGVGRHPSGAFVATWFDGFEIFARVYSSAGAPTGSEFRVNSYTTFNQYRTSVGIDDAGQFTVAWVSQTNTGIATPGVYAQRYCMDGILVTPPNAVVVTQTVCQ